MLSETTPLVTYTLYFTLYKLQRPQFKSAKWNHTLRCAFGEYDDYVRFSIFWMTCIWFYFYFFNLISRYYKIFTDVSFSFEFFSSFLSRFWDNLYHSEIYYLNEFSLLSNNGLTGTIPTSFSDLPRLQILWVVSLYFSSCVYLYGSILL